MVFQKNRCWLLMLSLIFSATIFFFLSVFKRPFGVENYSKIITVGGKKVRVGVADTPARKEKGLSDRKSLCDNCGMFFVFDTQALYPFWMRRMYFDIDVLWILSDQVVDITYGAKKPSEEDFERPKEIYQSKVPVDKVLEVNAGWVEKNGIKAGDVVKY